MGERAAEAEEDGHKRASGYETLIVMIRSVVAPPLIVELISRVQASLVSSGVVALSGFLTLSCGRGSDSTPPKQNASPTAFTFKNCSGQPQTSVFASSLPDEPQTPWRELVDAELAGLSDGSCARTVRVASIAWGDPIVADRLAERDVLETLTAALDIKPNDECYARAHLVASRVGALSVPHAKIFVVGDVFNPNNDKPWNYHVAVLIPVDEAGGKRTLRVIDPALAGGPLFTLAAWLDGVKPKRGQIGSDAAKLAVEIADRGQLYPSITQAGASLPPLTDFKASCVEARKAKEFSMFGSGHTTWRFRSFTLDCGGAENGFCIIQPPEPRAGQYERFGVSTHLWPKAQLERWRDEKTEVRVSVTRKAELSSAAGKNLDGMVTSLMSSNTVAACQDF